MARTTNRNGAVRIGTDATWRHVSTGMRHGAVVRADGSLWTWDCGARPSRSEEVSLDGLDRSI